MFPCYVPYESKVVRAWTTLKNEERYVDFGTDAEECFLVAMEDGRLAWIPGRNVRMDVEAIREGSTTHSAAGRQAWLEAWRKATEGRE